MVMQENHSFDHDFGMLPLATGTLYYLGPCVVDDHQCVDGLSARTPTSEWMAPSSASMRPIVASRRTSIMQVVLSKFCSLAIAASQPIQYKQYS